MTQVLARKWRPRSFAELVGQEHVVRALANALDAQRLHHAYLLTGTRGVGKTTLARITAKALNCETGVSSKPCGVCSACREIDAGRFVDLIELDAASHTQVDNMRELLEGALYAPTSGRHKVYIIDEVHMLSRNAFNAMLKTLEEPPAHVTFILATTDPQKIPVTVLSRCLQFNLKPIPPAQIRGRLEHVLQAEGIEFETTALHLLAQAAQGSLRDSLSLLDQAIAHGGGTVTEIAVRAMLGVVDREYGVAILQALADANGARLMECADAIEARSLAFDGALQDLGVLLHRIAVLQLAPEAVEADDPDLPRLRTLAGRLSPDDVQLWYQIALQGRGDLELAPDEYAGFTMTLLRMLAFAPSAVGEPADRAVKPGAAEVSHETSSQPSLDPRAAQPDAPGRIALQPADWPGFVRSLAIGGMAGMLANHCELVGHEGHRVVLCVPDAHKYLLEDSYKRKLKALLEARLGHPLRVEFNIGGQGNTPAELHARDREAQQERAIQAIERDPFVRELVEDLGGRVVSDSIRPLS